MENRNAIVADYFKLRMLLNRTNLVRDQKTEVEFHALQRTPPNYCLIATLRGIESPKHIELCKMNLGFRWEPSEHSGLYHLEEFAARYLATNLGYKFSEAELNAW